MMSIFSLILLIMRGYFNDQNYHLYGGVLIIIIIFSINKGTILNALLYSMWRGNHHPHYSCQGIPYTSQAFLSSSCRQMSSPDWSFSLPASAPPSPPTSPFISRHPSTCHLPVTGSRSTPTGAPAQHCPIFNAWTISGQTRQVVVLPAGLSSHM